MKKTTQFRRRPTTPLIRARDLQDLGVAVAIYPRLMTGATIMGMRNAPGMPRQLEREGRVIELPALAVSFQKANEPVGLPAIRDLERRSLTPDPRAANDRNKAPGGVRDETPLRPPLTHARAQE